MQIQQHFGFTKLVHAERLQQRAHDMITQGFEWTLRFGEPRNSHATTYPLTPPCCTTRINGQKSECLVPNYVKCVVSVDVICTYTHVQTYRQYIVISARKSMLTHMQPVKPCIHIYMEGTRARASPELVRVLLAFVRYRLSTCGESALTHEENNS